MTSGILPHHHSYGFRSVRFAVDGWSRCSIDGEVHRRGFLASSIINAVSWLLSLSKWFLGWLLLRVLSPSVILPGDRLGLSRVAPGFIRLHVCSNFRTNACSGGGILVGLL